MDAALPLVRPLRWILSQLFGIAAVYSGAVLPVYQILSSPILLPPLSKRKRSTYLLYCRENNFYYCIGFSYTNMSFDHKMLNLLSY